MDESLTVFPTISSSEDAHYVLSVLIEIGNIRVKISQASSFIACLLAQNPQDQEASVIQGQISKLSSQYEITLTNFQAEIAKISSNTWEDILKSDVLKDYKFLLTEWRKEAESSLPSNEKTVLSSVSTDGYHAWGQMYQTLMGNLEIELQIEGRQQDAIGVETVMGCGIAR